MLIYISRNILNGKVYVGQTTKTLEQRIVGHINDAMGRNTNMVFHKALRKHGPESFEWKVLEKCEDLEELDEMEFHYIKQFKSILPNGYNMYYNTYCQAGELNPNYGNNMTEENKELLSKKAKKRYRDKAHPWLGKKHSDTSKKKMSISAKNRPPVSESTRIKMSNNSKGRKHSEESKQIMSERQKGNNNSFFGKQHTNTTKTKISDMTSGENNPFYGKKHTEETRRKMRELWQKRKAGAKV